MRKVKLIAILILVSSLVIVIVQNRSPVEAHFLFVTVEMPVIVLLMITAALGLVLGLLVALYGGSKPRG